MTTKSEERTLGRDALGLVLFGVGAFVAVLCVLWIRQGGVSAEPRLVERMVDSLAGAIGGWPTFVLAAGIGACGAAIFVAGKDLSTGRHALGVLGVALGLAFILGAFGPGLGGRLGSAFPELAGKGLGGALGVVLGLVVGGALAWTAWLSNRQIAEKEGELESLTAAVRSQEGDGVSLAEAAALGAGSKVDEVTKVKKAALKPAATAAAAPTAADVEPAQQVRTHPSPAVPARPAVQPSAGAQPIGADLAAGAPAAPARPGKPVKTVRSGEAKKAVREVGPVGNAAPLVVPIRPDGSRERVDEVAPIEPAARRAPRPSWEAPDFDEALSDPVPIEDAAEAVAPESAEASLDSEATLGEALAEAEAAAQSPADIAALEARTRALESPKPARKRKPAVAPPEPAEAPKLDEAAGAGELQPPLFPDIDGLFGEEDDDDVEDLYAAIEAEEEAGADVAVMETGATLAAAAEPAVEEPEALEEAEDEEEYEYEEEEAEYEEEGDEEEDEDEAEYEEYDEEEEEDEDEDGEYEEEEAEYEEEDAEYEEDEEEEEGVEYEEAEDEEYEEEDEEESAEAEDEEAEAEYEEEEVGEDDVLVPVAPAEEVAAEAAPAEAAALPSRTYEAGCLILEHNRVAVSMLQRHFQMDFKEATAILDDLQSLGLIGPYIGGRTREICMTAEEWEQLQGSPQGTAG